MKRLSVSAVLLAVLMLAAVPAVASANVNGQPWIGNDIYARDYTWTNNGGGRWQDNRCGTSAEEFNVTLYIDSSYGGVKVKVCARKTQGDGGFGSESEWCSIPLRLSASIESMWFCRAGLNVHQANDAISSIKVNSIKGSQPKCMRIFRHEDYGGDSLTFKNDIPNLHAYPKWFGDWGDEASSMRRKNSEAACAQSVN